MKCKYCGKKGIAGTYCDESCKTKSQDFEARIERDKYKFLACMIVSIIAPLFILFFDGIDPLYSIALILMLFGLTVIVFPFATPETFELGSVKTVVVFVRSLGVILMLVGVIIAALIW